MFDWDLQIKVHIKLWLYTCEIWNMWVFIVLLQVDEELITYFQTAGVSRLGFCSLPAMCLSTHLRRQTTDSVLANLNSNTLQLIIMSHNNGIS